MDQFIGQIAIFPWDWAPRNWAKCDGQLMSIRENSALFALIGTEFGGNGRDNYALPNLSPIKTENGGDLAYYIALYGIFPPRS